jgi:hypothetical protein
MSEKTYLKNYQEILNEVTDFNKIASKGPFEVSDENITIQEKANPLGKDYFEVEVTRGDMLLHINGFIKHGSEQYETVGIRVAKIVGEDFESVYPSNNIKLGAAEGTEEKLNEALTIADNF